MGLDTARVAETIWKLICTYQGFNPLPVVKYAVRCGTNLFRIKFAFFG